MEKKVKKSGEVVYTLSEDEYNAVGPEVEEIIESALEDDEEDDDEYEDEEYEDEDDECEWDEDEDE